VLAPNYFINDLPSCHFVILYADNTYLTSAAEFLEFEINDEMMLIVYGSKQLFINNVPLIL